MTPELIWFGLFVFLGFTTQIATGFGANVIAIALGSLFLPIETMLPILVSLNVVMTSSTITKIGVHIHKPTLFKLIFPLMLAGMILGIALLDYLSNTHLKHLLACLVLWFSIRESYKLYTMSEQKPKGKFWQGSWTFVAGIMHGLFVSGGPILVYALSRTSLNKAQFRATLIATWLGLNSFYAVVLWHKGVLENYYVQIAYYLPVLLLSLFAGQFIHKRINEILFKKVVYALLALSAIILLF